MNGDMLGDDLSGLSTVTYLVGNSPDEILAQLAKIRLPTQVLYGYSQGAKHYMFIRTMQKIRRGKPVLQNQKGAEQ